MSSTAGMNPGAWTRAMEYMAHKHPEWSKKSDISSVTSDIASVVTVLDFYKDVADQPHTSEDPHVLYAVNAQLAVFPHWLRPKYGPLLVVIETWSDGVVMARWPEGRLYGEGS